MLISFLARNNEYDIYVANGNNPIQRNRCTHNYVAYCTTLKEEFCMYLFCHAPMEELI